MLDSAADLLAEPFGTSESTPSSAESSSPISFSGSSGPRLNGARLLVLFLDLDLSISFASSGPVAEYFDFLDPLLLFVVDFLLLFPLVLFSGQSLSPP